MATESYKFTSGDPAKDFFKQNPHWRYLDSSVRLLSECSKEIASKVRWVAFYIMDPDSKFYRFPLNKRIEKVVKHYIKGDFNVYLDEDSHRIVCEDYQYVFDMYPAETMSKDKYDYYERERAYQLLSRQESESTNLKLKSDVQVKLFKIKDELDKLRQKFEDARDEEGSRARGRQQPGSLFRK